MPLTYPIITRNGTDADSLLELYLDANNALEKAIDALQKASPHGRDYQTDPPKWDDAMREHKARTDALAKVRDELQELAEHVADAS